MSLAGILIERAENEKKNKVISDASLAIRNLKRQNKALEEKGKLIKKHINEGSYECSTNNFDDSQAVSAESAEQLYRISKANQKLEGMAYMTGITANKQKNQISYMFDPYIQGEPRGPYFVRLGPSYILLANDMPQGVPVRKIHKKSFDPRGHSSSENLKSFLKTVYRYLRSYLSREQQVVDLKDGDLALYLKNVETFNHFTSVSITLQIREEENEDAKQIELSLDYEPDSDRPTLGSLKVEVPEDWEDAVDSMTEQCQTLYTSRLKEGILSAFS